MKLKNRIICRMQEGAALLAFYIFRHELYFFVELQDFEINFHFTIFDSIPKIPTAFERPVGVRQLAENVKENFSTNFCRILSELSDNSEFSQNVESCQFLELFEFSEYLEYSELFEFSEYLEFVENGRMNCVNFQNILNIKNFLNCLNFIHNCEFSQYSE